MWPVRTRKKRSSRKLWSSSRAPISSIRWVPASPTVCCWWALRVPVRPCWPAPVQARQGCPSTPSPALTLWRCTSAWAHPACVTCSIRPKRPCPASSLSTRSMLWVVSAAQVWAAVTMSCWWRWMALRPTTASSSWRPPTVPTFWIRRCCVPAVLTVRSMWVCRMSRDARRS